MAQVREVILDQAAWYSAVASAEFALPSSLVPANTLDFTDEDTKDYNAFITWARSSATNNDEWQARTEMAFALFLEQRRKTRTWVIGAGVVAALLGGVMGFYVGKPDRG